jgi:hypothetical protein
MEQFLKGMDTHPDKTLLLFLSGINDKTMSREFDQDCVGITCAMLRAVEKAMEDQGTTIEEFCDPEKVSTVVTVFEDLKYFKEIRKARFTYRNYIYNAAFDDSLKEIVKNVFSAVRMKRTGKAVKINKFTAFGMECREMLTKAVSSWYEGKEIAEIKERASNLKLDREAVTGAETALKDVTRMMATEEVQEEAVTRPVEPVRKISDSWQGLAEALDEKQKGYLRAVLEGNGQQYLRDIGSIQSRMEDSINALAMDAVGDNILEGGVIFDEYADNVRALL